MQEKQYIVEMESGGKIALYRLNNSDPIGLPLIIVHGTISNSEAVRGLGRYLTQLGFDCWLLEWGGHGQSTAFNKRQDFEYPAFNDLPTAISKIIKLPDNKEFIGFHIVVVATLRLCILLVILKDRKNLLAW